MYVSGLQQGFAAGEWVFAPKGLSVPMRTDTAGFRARVSPHTFLK